MPTRNVVLTEHQAQFVDRVVASGRYQNASEVLRDGLRLLEQRDQEQADRLQVLREAVTLGVADIDAGRYAVLGTPDSLRTRVAHLRKHPGAAR